MTDKKKYDEQLMSFEEALQRFSNVNALIEEGLEDNEKSIVKITSTEIEKGIETYNVIVNKVGIISEIGSQSLDYTSHICLDGLDYKIYITSEQDAQLRNYYKSATIDFKIKQRRSLKSGNVVSGKLISFFVKSSETLTESLRQLSDEDLSFLLDLFVHETT